MARLFPEKKTGFFLKNGVFNSLLLISVTILFSFVACNSPMGMGDSIDWEPPILTLDPGPNPRYVRLGTTLTGTVTDNVGVQRVILREAGSTEEIYFAVITGDRWEIMLDFSEDKNGEKLAVEVVAYDMIGNSGEQSMRAISLIIDIRPPFIQDVYIQRTPMRTAILEPLADLQELETEDLHGERSAHANRYQNGWFTVNARIMEEETRINDIKLAIYDYREPDTMLLLLERDAGSSTFSPRWLLKEEEILAAGEILWPDYTANYYNDERYYYRVEIIANDRSENELVDIVEYFCMWQKSDVPKGTLDPVVGTYFTRGSTLPVEFFDDDSLDWAYAGLLTKHQWNATYSGNPKDAWLNDTQLTMPNLSTDNAKLDWLKEQLRNDVTIYNWKYSKRHSTENIANNDLKERIVDLIGDTKPDEKVHYVPTGDRDSDYGEFVLFTLVADKKQVPHDGTGPVTNADRWSKRSWEVEVIDENIPLIVFDTVDTRESGYNPDNHSGSNINESIGAAQTGNSPEENTFPRLTDGRYFTINGYTLRENRAQTNEVIAFRMAWIPYGMENGPDNYITAVQNKLKNYGNANIPLPPGVVAWDLTNDLVTGHSNTYFNDINGIPFKKQAFRKEFDILGGTRAANIQLADYQNTQRTTILTNPAAKQGITEPHFVYHDKLENETKLFIFYAQDNVGNEVFRHLRILGNKTPPDLGVYNMTGRVQPDENQKPPYIYDTDYMEGKDNIDDEVRAKYKADLYAMQETGYNLMRTYALTGNPPALNPDLNRAEPLQAFPRDTTLMFWVTAERSGELAVKNIRMRDVTYNSNIESNIGHYNSNARSLSYYERLPEIGQRIFVFSAEDTLGNEAMIQRTVAVTNAAVLSEISTPQQNGSYGIGEEVIIRAYFSNLVRWRNTNGDSKPQLNVRYKRNNNYVIESLNTVTDKNTDQLYLAFEFVVGEGYSGDLETMYSDNSLTGTPLNEDETAYTNRPIWLPAGVVIVDSERNDRALTPGNDAYDWTSEDYSLQDKKTITLQGIRPVINNALVINGKTPHSDGAYYFKSGETIDFTLKANAPIFTYNISGSGNPNPKIRFRIQGSDYYADYQRNIDANTMLFSYTVSTIANGEINKDSIGIDTQYGAIGDSVGNFLASTVNTAGTLLSDSNYPTAYNPTNTVRIDRTKPPAPVTKLNGNQVGPSSNAYFNTPPLLEIDNPPSADEPWCDTKQYSLNGGLTWVEYTAPLYISNGQLNLSTRYIDKAGNEGEVTSKPIEVNANFPRLLGVTAVQGNGTYRIGQRLDFEMSFSDIVSYGNAANVTITLQDRTSTGNGTTSNSIVLSATGGSGTSTITFAWSGNAGTNPFIDKDMLSGLRITAINLSGLTDRFGTAFPSNVTIVPSTTTPWQINVPALGSNTAYSVPYTLSSVIVSTITPVVLSRIPVNAQGAGANFSTSVSPNNRTVTLTFNKPVQKGNGTITLRPHGTYAIPAVMEHNGYYVEINSSGQIETDTRGFDNRYASGGTNRTYVSGFSDIFNNLTTEGSVTAADHRTNLIGSTNISEPAVSLQSALPVGPYQRMTHGLTLGMGYTGNYGNTATINTNNSATINLPGTNAPGPRNEVNPNNGSNFMIPDIETKWVLHYGYNDLFATGTPSGRTVSAANIRAAFTNAKWRWQEFAVTASNVAVSGNTVTITLSEPLLPGLQWTLYYPNGTFSDEAGNAVAASAQEAYWFWSAGAQRPVIRVDRKSYDARNGANLSGAWNKSGWAYNATGFNGAITSFNNIGYVITTETPSSKIYYGTRVGTAANLSGVTGAWGGRVNTDFTGNNISPSNINWGGPLATVNSNTRATTSNEYTATNNTVYSNTRANTTNQYTATTNTTGTTATNHNLGANNTVLQVSVTSGTTTADYWLRIIGAQTFRLYNTQADASTTTAGNGVNVATPITLNNVITTTAIAHNFGATGRVFLAPVTSGTTTTEYWLRVTGNQTFRLYNSQADASAATAGNGVNVATPLTISSVLTTGQWVRPNLIFRNNYQDYYDLMLYHTDLQQRVGGMADTANALTGRFYGFRSFNKDATLTELNAIARSSGGSSEQNVVTNFTYSAFEASKNYIVAETRIDHGSSTTTTSPRGYEGVFRTVIMNNMSTVTVTNNNNPIILFGTNRINGIPTVPAFPLKDGVDQVDSRFGKFYFRDESSAVGNGDRNRYYWVSSEIVSSWFIQNYGRGTGGSYTRKGDNNDWITAGYGDLVNTLDIEAW
ncbi:MAG: hypothetical protein FWC03_08315 [Treponema sp.]|nr:hypothetical protein [Treponema sp.]